MHPLSQSVEEHYGSAEAYIKRAQKEIGAAHSQVPSVPTEIVEIMDTTENWDLHQPGKNGFTILMEVCDRSVNDPSMKEALAALGQHMTSEDVNAVATGRRAKGWTALHILAANADRGRVRADMIQQLVFMRAQVDAELDNGKTPLLAAASTSHLGAIHKLLELRADPFKKMSGTVTAVDLTWNNNECKAVFVGLGVQEGSGVDAAGRWPYIDVKYRIKC